ncbi:ATP-dependent protease subunit HslV [Anaplasmataceae bacterium AB001_6]|nr:ATP-dependent protease subunit HslV [Anaplasmataceae bacterium AB001_6]
MENKDNRMYGTTILTLYKGGKVVVIGDGQVSLGSTMLKGTAVKVRRMDDDKIVIGFAGVVADSLALAERLETKLRAYPNQLMRSCIELSKEWRMDKFLRKLDSMMIVANADDTLVLTGNGEVLKPENRVLAIGSGGNYALAAAKALLSMEKNNLDAVDIAKKAMTIAADICIYTNHNFTIEVIDTDCENVKDDLKKSSTKKKKSTKKKDEK